MFFSSNRYLLTIPKHFNDTSEGCAVRIKIGLYFHIKTLKPQWFQGFSLSQKQCLALFLALRHKKTRTSAGTDPLKTKIVFMLRYQYSRIGRENQSQGFILPAEFECTAPFGRRWPSSSDLSHAHTRPG